MASRTPVGLRVELGAGLAASLHPDGALSITDAEGRAADFAPEAVEQLAGLLRMGGQVRASARRRRAAEAYVGAQLVESR